MPKKVRATGMIAQLFRSTENFEHLLSHDTLLQVRAREPQAGCGISFLAGRGLKICPSCGRMESKISGQTETVISP